MIIVTVALPDGRDTFTASSDMTIKQFMRDNGINQGTATVMLDGMALDSAGLNRTFADHGVQDDCTIAVCAKLQNA